MIKRCPRCPTCNQPIYVSDLEKEEQYQRLTKLLHDQRKARARKFKDPERGQTTLDNFSIDR